MTVFGAEFINLKEKIESNRYLIYKVQMLDIKLIGEVNISSDNKSVCTNSLLPESTLKETKKSIEYHAIHEDSSAKEFRV